MIAIGNDHTAVAMKHEIIALLEEMGLEYKDYGATEETSSDYPVFAARVARAVAKGTCSLGIVICGTGIGVSIAANKVQGVRCALCAEPYSALMARQHNNANVLALGARTVGAGLARMIARTFLEASFQGGRHARRVEQMARLEKGEEIE